EELARHVGCSQGYVSRVAKELITSNKLTPPPDRKGKDGKLRPATYQKKKPGAAPPPPKPAKGDRYDETGIIIPPDLLPLWDRANEVSGALASLKSIRLMVEHGAEANDPVFTEVNVSSVRAELKQAYFDIKRAIPYAVCPTC